MIKKALAFFLIFTFFAPFIKGLSYSSGFCAYESSHGNMCPMKHKKHNSANAHRHEGHHNMRGEDRSKDTQARHSAFFECGSKKDAFAALDEFKGMPFASGGNDSPAAIHIATLDEESGYLYKEPALNLPERPPSL